MCFISLAAESLLKQINFFFYFMLNLIALRPSNVPLIYPNPAFKKTLYLYLPEYLLSCYSDALLISLLYDRDSPRLESSHKPPPHCFCPAGQLSNKPCGALLAPLHMTDATDSPWPLFSSACIDPSPPKNRFGHNNSAAR